MPNKLCSKTTWIHTRYPVFYKLKIGNFLQNVKWNKYFSYRSISKLSNSCGLQNERYVVRKVRTKLGSEKVEHKTGCMFNLFSIFWRPYFLFRFILALPTVALPANHGISWEMRIIFKFKIHEYTSFTNI